MALQIWYNDCDYVIAESAEDAMDVCVEEFRHESRLEYVRATDIHAEDWQTWSDDVLFPFTEELEFNVPNDPPTVRTIKLEPGEAFKKRGEPTDAATYYTVEKNGAIYTKTRRRMPAEWITEHGRGYFASSET